MCEHAAPELHRQEHDVLDLRLQVAPTMRRHAHGGFPKQVQCHRDVVRPEAPERVFIGANLPQVDAQTIQVIDPPELAALDQGPQPLHRRVEQEQMPRQHGDPPRGGGARHRLRIVHAQRERLFDQARLPRLDAL